MCMCPCKCTHVCVAALMGRKVLDALELELRVGCDLSHKGFFN